MKIFWIPGKKTLKVNIKAKDIFIVLQNFYKNVAKYYKNIIHIIINYMYT